MGRECGSSGVPSKTAPFWGSDLGFRIWGFAPFRTEIWDLGFCTIWSKDLGFRIWGFAPFMGSVGAYRAENSPVCPQNPFATSPWRPPWVGVSPAEHAAGAGGMFRGQGVFWGWGRCFRAGRGHQPGSPAVPADEVAAAGRARWRHAEGQPLALARAFGKSSQVPRG